MPKQPIDYAIQPISFYRFVCNDVNIKSCYVGHTASFRHRKSCHKSICNNPKSKSYNLLIYQTIRTNGGFDNWRMLEISSQMCVSKRDAEMKEQTYMEELNAVMNSQRAYTSQEQRAEHQVEYNKKNATKIAEQQAEYNKKNAVKIAEQQAEYNKKNAVKIAEQQAEYNKKNAVRRAEYNKNNRTLLNEKQRAYRAKSKSADGNTLDKTDTIL